MPAFRLKHGLALGDYGRLDSSTATTAGLFTSGDTTPDIRTGNLFFTQNAAATSIVYFDGQRSNLDAQPEEGQFITVIVLDNLTSFVQSEQLQMAGAGTYSPDSGTTLQFVYSNSTWYEVGKGSAGDNEGRVKVENCVADTRQLDATGVSTFLLNASALICVIAGMVGGYPGQVVHMVNLGSSAASIEMTNSDGTLSFQLGTASFSLAATQAYTFVNRSGTGNWSMVADVPGD